MHLNDPFWRWRVVHAPSDAPGAGEEASSGGESAGEGSPAPEPNAAASDPAPGAPSGEAAEAPRAPQQKPWFTQRIDRLTREKYEITRQRDELAAQLHQARQAAAPQARQEIQQELRQQGSPYVNPMQLEQMVSQRAYAIAEAQRFDDRCNAVYADGEKVPGFTDALETLQRNFGNFDPVYGNVALPYDFLQMVVDTDDPVGVIKRLGENPAMADRIFNEPNPIRRATQIAALAVRSGGGAGGRGQGRVSEAPGPVRAAVGGNNGSAPVSLYDDTVPLDKWMEERNKQVAQRGR